MKLISAKFYFNFKVVVPSLDNSYYLICQIDRCRNGLYFLALPMGLYDKNCVSGMIVRKQKSAFSSVI